MKRRNLFAAMSMAGPSAMLAAQAPAVPRRAAQPIEPEPKAFFSNDGRHAAGLYQFAPPLTAADVTYTVDQLVACGIDTLFYSAGPEVAWCSMTAGSQSVGATTSTCSRTRFSIARRERCTGSLPTGSIR